MAQSWHIGVGKMATIRKRLGKYHTQVRKNGKSITKSFTNRKDALKWAKEQEVAWSFLHCRNIDEMWGHSSYGCINRHSVKVIKRPEEQPETGGESRLSPSKAIRSKGLYH